MICLWRWCLAVALCSSAAFSQSTYRDPQQRFSLQVPAGWTTAPEPSGLTIARGRAYARLVMVEGRGLASDLVSHFAAEAGKQWKNFQELKRGESRFAGEAGAFAFYNGTNPAGTRAILKITGAAAAGKGYVLILSAPETEFAALRNDLERMESSFSAGGASSGGGSAEKLAALEAAYKAGVLTRDEMEAKRRELAGAALAARNPLAGQQSARAKNPLAAAGGSAPGQNPLSPGARGSGREFQAPDGSFAATLPAGWRARPANPALPSLHAFEPENGGEERILIGAGPSTAGSIQELMQEGVQVVMQLVPGLQPAGQPSYGQIGGAPSAEVRYRGTTGQGVELASWHGILLKDRFYFAVLSLARAEQAGAAEQAARSMYQSMRPARVPENMQLARAIVGRWTFSQGSQSGAGSNRSNAFVSRQITFAVDGRFEYVGGVYVDTSLPGGGGGTGGRDTRYSGTYQIFGNQLRARFDQGGEQVFTLELVQGGGLKLNGDLYIRE